MPSRRWFRAKQQLPPLDGIRRVQTPREREDVISTVYIPLSEPVPAAFSQEIGKRLFFVSDEIQEFKLIEKDALVHGVELVLAGENAQQQLAEKIDYIVQTDILQRKEIPSSVIWRSNKAPGWQPRMFQTLVEKGIAFETGPGLVGFGEPVITLVDSLDRRLKNIAKASFAAREFQYPTLLPTRVMEEMDYFSSFPHFAMFVTRLHNDVDVYRAFLADYESQRQVPQSIFSYCRSHEFCLPPTMCYHTFHQLRGGRLDSNQVVTSRGKSFRFESKYAAGLERLWDFTIREVVFLGTREFVLESRQQFMRQAQALIEELDLPAYCEVAHDPFFVGPQVAGKIFSQKLMELKYELRANIDAGKSIAVGSFNYHEMFFGQRFRLTRDGESPVSTGCVGFGLERLAYAFLSRHGLDEQKIAAVSRDGN